jgi:hypothetical protein
MIALVELQRLAKMRSAALYGVIAPFRVALALIGPVIPTETSVPPAAINFDWLAGLCLQAAIAVSITEMARYVDGAAAGLFWGGLVVLFLPIAIRIAWPGVARFERVLLLILLAVASFAVKLLSAPTGFVQFDEFLHWVTATDILERHRLFLANSLLPVSPLYPGIELLTTALANLAGLSIFAASTIILLILRGVFICALYGFYERMCGSPRIAAIACLVYMGSSGYVLFDSQFAYESLAVVLMVLALLIEADMATRQSSSLVSLALMLAVLLALGATHHMTTYFTVFFFVALAGLEFLRSPAKTLPVVLIAGSAVAVVAMLSRFIGNPSEEYLGPVMQHGADEFLRMIDGGRSTRQYFVASDGSRTPIWLQLPGMASVVIVALGLATGFLRSLARASSTLGQRGWPALIDFCCCRWRNSRLVLLTLLTLAWPLSVGLRLTAAGWEIGNRMGSFAFLGVGIVVAISIICFWRRTPQWSCALATGGALTTIFLGGIVTGWGVAAAPGPYKVGGDAQSIEPMGIDAAMWTRTLLGQGNRFATNRENALLVATYGRQDVVTDLYDGIDASYVFYASRLSEGELRVIRDGDIDYLLVDLRLSTATPLLGSYFDSGEAEEIHDTPLKPEALLKFDHVDGVSRVFDDGWIVIFDVRALHHAQ